MASPPSREERVGGQAGADFLLPAEKDTGAAEVGLSEEQGRKRKQRKNVEPEPCLFWAPEATAQDVRAGCTEANLSGRNFPLLKKVLLLLHSIAGL